jgi:RNA polymerase sigma factor (sigma-70 family)
MTDTGNEYLVKVTIRNNLILRQMKKLGIKTQTELAKLSGLQPITVGKLIGLKRRPLHALTGEWLDTAFALSAALHVEPEELWTEKQRGMALDSNTREVSMSEDAVMQLASGDRLEHNVIASKLVADALTTLKPREQDIIRARFFDGDTLEEIGDRQGVSRGRIQQLEAKALRKLKHPSRSRPLRQLIQGDEQ